MSQDIENSTIESSASKKTMSVGNVIKTIVICVILAGVVVVYFYFGHPSHHKRFQTCEAEMEGKTGCTFDGLDLMVAKCVGGVWDKANGERCEQDACYQYRDHAKCGRLRDEICKGIKGEKSYKCSRQASYSYMAKEVYDID